MEMREQVHAVRPAAYLYGYAQPEAILPRGNAGITQVKK